MASRGKTKKNRAENLRYLAGTIAGIFFVLGLSVAWHLSGFRERSAHPRSSGNALSQVEAELRARQVSRVSYRLDLKVGKAEAQFSGKTVIAFHFDETARDLSEKLRIDFSGGAVSQVEVNGKAMPRPGRLHDGKTIQIPLSKIKGGANEIVIAYTHPYSKDGNGLHAFLDPEDGETYLYSHFEPYNANRLFPCFDQPDLKATYQIEVDAPEAWEVISSRMGVATVRSPGERHWSFPVSEKFSTYLISLHAGPYSKWESQEGDIPLRLFARRSLAQYVDHEEWFDLTKRGLQYFPVFFKTPYPYGKYDQIIVPDFNSGAMENVAAVTFTENYVYRSRATQARKMGRADTILHEMAHMWFGNLVTMKWWNGLWLNESFATYMSYRALAETTQFPGVWQYYFTDTKIWAYDADNAVTTHPIEVPVEDTEVATANFDGITYGKGGSVLKQLAYLQGDAFSRGLRIYFDRFANGNTNLSDFIDAQAEASGRDYSLWQRDWLTTSGMNTVRAEWSCEGDGAAAKVTSFEMVQSPFRDNSVLRSHRTKVAFLSGGGKNGVRVAHVADVEYSAVRTEVPTLLGKPCPKAVFPNYDDFDYVRVSLDEVSTRFVMANIGIVQNAFLRQMLWQTLWEMVTDAQLPPRDYVTAVLTNARLEADPKILGSLLSRVARGTSIYLTALTLLPPSEVLSTAGKIERVTRERMLEASPGTDHQQLWFEAYLRMVRASEGLAWVADLFEGRVSLPGFELGQDHRWSVLHALAAGNHEKATAWIEAELKRDPSDAGKKRSFRALASVPNEKARRLWLARVLRQKDQGVFRPAELKPVAWFLLTVWDEPFSRASIQPFLKALPQLARTEDEDYLSDVSSSLVPLICEDEVIERVGQYLEEQQETLPESVVRNLRVWKQDLETCRRVRQASAV